MDELYPIVGFEEFPLELHHAMVRDEVRMDAFERAIRAVVRPGDVVVDVGTGTGVLGLIALRAGAARVVALDRSAILETARRAGERNARVASAGGRIEFLRLDARTGALPPLAANVMICELLGNFGLEEEIVPVLARLREHWLVPGGRLVPGRVTLRVAPVESPGLASKLEAWRVPCRGLDLSDFRALAFERPYHVRDGALTLLAEPADLHRVDLAADDRMPRRMSARFHAARHGTVHGFATWFEAELGGGVLLSTAPGAAPTHWGQVLFPVGEPHEVRAGDPVRFQLALAATATERLWEWSGALGAEAGHAPETVFRRRAATPL